MSAWLPALAPLLIGLPVLVAIARSLGDLLALGHPIFGDVTGTSIDGYAVYLGQALYQDPNAGYTASPYTPLLPLLIGGLDHLYLWTGWPVLLSVLAELGLIGLAAALAYRPAGPSRGERLVAAAGAVGFGALTWWLVSCLVFNFLYGPHVDQPAWALALGGLAVVPAAARGSRPGLAACVMLLSAACWTKQTTVVAVVAALAGLGLAVLAGRASPRVPIAFLLGFGALNLVLFGVLQYGTDGWASTILIELKRRNPQVVALRQGMRELVEQVALPLALATAFGVALAVRRLGEGGLPRWRRERLWPDGWRAQVAVLLGIFVMLDALPAVYFRSALGGVFNQYIGIAWALGLLAAAGFGACLRHRPTAWAAAAAVLGLFAVTESSPAQRLLADANIEVAPKSARIVAEEEFPGLRAYARTHTVFHPTLGDLNGATTGRLYQNQANVAGLVAADLQPGYVVDALLGRRFDVAYLFADTPDYEFEAGTGKYEDNYLWKLNEVIGAKYRPFAAVPPQLEAARTVPAVRSTFVSPGVLERRPGRDPAPWMRYCFGPFHIAGAEWKIRRGGGFWCRPGGRADELRLVRTSAGFTEVRADGVKMPVGGRLGVSLPAGRGVFRVAGPGWKLDGRAAGRSRIALSLVTDGGQAHARVAADTVTLRFVEADRPALEVAGRAVSVAIPGSSGGALSLGGTSDSAVRYDLARLRA
jgi:hypothetical protein